ILLNKPSDYLTMEQLGELYQAVGDKSKASDYYEESLRYFPFSYEVNAKIRTLNDQTPVFELVPEIDPVEMIEEFEAKFKPAYKESYDIVLEKKSLIVFESMATAGTHEFMIHMNDESAIEYWQNLNFGPEPYRTLYFDELLTIKQSGEKINAERSGGEVVFTNLEVDDYIYVAYHEEQKRGGKSAAFVSDVFSINSFAPLYQSEYHLLVEGDTEFDSYFSREELEPALTEEAGFRHYTWSLTNPPVIKEETNALPSKDLTNNLHISMTPAWGNIVQWYSDLSGYQSVPDYSIQTLVEELFGGRTLNEEEKAKEIYEFVTKNIQYSSVDFRQSNFVPQKASRVYQSRLGDCKDVSTLYVAMAKEAGLDANLVLINTSDNGQKAVVLPSLNFNHCIVNVDVKGEKTFLELTDSNLPFGYLSQYHKGASILEIPSSGDLAMKTLTRLDFNPGYQDRVKRNTEVMIQANNQMAIQRETVKTGIRASSFVDSYYNMDKELQDQKLTQSIKDDFSSAVSLKSFEITELEPRHDTARYTYDFLVEGDVVSMGAFRSFKLPFSDVLIHMAVFEDRDRINDFNFVAYENTNVYEEEMMIELPDGKAFMEVPGNVSAEWEDFSYDLQFEQIDDKTVKVQRHFEVLRENITPEDFPAFRAFMTKVNEAENTHLLFR
ncbi:MAG: transglutaminase domain-containing protein, partial [Bacteroidota bacterium]